MDELAWVLLGAVLVTFWIFSACAVPDVPQCGGMLICLDLR